MGERSQAERDEEVDEINSHTMDDRTQLRAGASEGAIKRKKMLNDANKQMEAAEASGQQKALGEMSYE